MGRERRQLGRRHRRLVPIGFLQGEISVTRPAMPSLTVPVADAAPDACPAHKARHAMPAAGWSGLAHARAGTKRRARCHE